MKRRIVYFFVVLLVALLLACDGVDPSQKFVDECQRNNPGWDAKDYCWAQWRKDHFSLK